MNFRKLKIGYIWRGKYSGEKQVPQINLSGNWLQKAGFEVGQNVKIEVQENRLIISNAD